jgi:hypothetical protein
MQYMILIYGDEQAYQSMPAEAQQDVFKAFMEYNAALAAGGVLRAGESLQPSFTASTIRMKDGRVQTTDGPFAETREQLGGYYVIETTSLDDAIAWAARCPAIHGGSLEVRPLAGVGVG